MRSYRYVVVSLIIALSMTPAQGSAGADFDAAARASVVIVSAHLGDRRDAIGAGVAVGRTTYGLRVLTARHVVIDGPVTLWVDRVPYPAEIVRTFAHRDLAIVDAIVPPSVSARTHIVELATEVRPDATDLVVWGEDSRGPREHRASIVDSTFASPADRDAPPLVAIACDACDRGDSGGGIFTRDGKLVAILTARFVTHDRRVLAIVGERVDATLYEPLETLAITR